MAAEDYDPSLQPKLDWWHVAQSSVFVLVAALISFCMGTRLELSLIISGIRCVVQLTMMGYVLDDVLSSNNAGIVVLMTLTLVLLGAYETTFNRAKKTFKGFFVNMLVILLVSNVFIAFLGSAFALKEQPFWSPPKFIPIVGMLLGNSMSSIAMATEQCLDHLSLNGPILEARLSFGATRFEAARPLAVEAIRVSMLPVITQLSVMGLINIPGTMVGLILAGTPMTDAVVYQQCIMFMIAASSALGVAMAVIACLMVLVDKHHSLRREKILDNPPLIRFKTIVDLSQAVSSSIGPTACFAKCRRANRRQEPVYEEVELR
ncbi:hypothetical protein BDB00DRAFT_979141 [Zychaea mexicana]|uniref:uncharacterized protein n=1 Tax=Zychaea mexicana TaxID=64656 RepID=UPI0022FE0935|nr:uncharacterized protein BDB00DRAFT_979141 [Zychaea mexicana]KAI9490932.1 hypothetical protein BDB00DRAFT_979141 [Zychaea mexicana]